MIAEQFDSTTVRQLLDDFGDSLFVLDMDRFLANLDRYRGAFRSHYPNTDLAYSYKTNYTPYLVKAVDEWGGLAEVVSEMEYDLALRVGVDPESIIYNGPAKTPRSMRRAMELGSTLNVDSPAQLDEVIQIARSLDLDAIRIGIRIAFDLDDAEPSRFGFDSGSPSELGSAIEAISQNKKLHLAGVHAHVMMRTRSTANGYRQLTQRLISVVDEYAIEPDFIDVGGGFFSWIPQSLVEQFGFTPPSPSDYAEAIGTPLAERFNGASAPQLIIEPGIGVVGDAGLFACRVIDVRTVGPMQIAQTTGSMHNIKPTLNNANLPLRVIPCGGERSAIRRSVDFVGYTCMENDVLYRGYEGSVTAGDIALFSNVGAYTTVLSPSFIRGRPPIVAWSSDGGFELVKNAEGVDDVFSTYRF